MCNKLKVVFFKFRNFWIFYVGIVGLAGVGAAHGYIKLAGQGAKNGIYEAFAGTICDSSFLFLLSLIAAWFIGNDFSNRTIHNEITTGCSRLSVLFVRELPVFLFAVILHTIYIFSTVIGVGIKAGFSFALFTKRDVLWGIVVLLQLLAIQTLVVLITFICAKVSAAIAVSVCFTFVACNVLRNYFDGKIFTSSCFCLAQNNLSKTLIPAGVTALATLIITVIVTYLVFRKKEIK